MVRVYITGHLKDYTGNKREFSVDTVGDINALILALDRMFPGIKDRIFDDQELTRPFVNIFVNGENIRDGARENTILKVDDTVHILPSVAGGWL